MNLQRTILRNLEARTTGMMPTGTLWGEVMLDEPGTSYTAFSKALTELEIKGQIVTLEGEERRKAKITDAGKLRLLEA